MANAIRALAMDAVEKAKSGHPGMPMGMADVATVLFTQFLKFDASAPDWPDRDRFVLSAGHGSMLLYALLHLTGYPGMTMDELRNFRQLGSKTAGHPEFGHAPGIETTTGPLGQGLGNAVGMALAERLLNARHGDKIVDHYTYAIAGDGCLMEGISHEAISLAGHLKLNKLIVLFDDNQISIDGPTSARRVRRPAGALQGFGLEHGVDRRPRSRRHRLCHRGRAALGPPDADRLQDRHRLRRTDQAGQGLHPRRAAGRRRDQGRAREARLGACAVRAAGKCAGRLARGGCARRSAAQGVGEARGQARQPGSATRSTRPQPRRSPPPSPQIKSEFAASPPKIATRVASQKVLEKLVPALPCLIGGSADLTGSNGTRTKDHAPVKPGDFGGNYIHYGVREHAMAAAMNGMALHGGLVPYGGTFLVFTDYCRPSIRLSALMGLRVIYVMTHNSIGLGEDGPTHQPVEHLAALRAIPNLNVFRPADPIETAECWELALKDAGTPSILALTRQGVPALRKAGAENLCAKGAYVLAEADGARDVTLLATGSEVGLAMEARELLAKEGLKSAVVSMPSWELFAAQPVAYREAVLGAAPRVGVEAAVGFGWERWLGENGMFVGMQGFGASAPAGKLYEHFGITPAKVADAARKLLSRLKKS